MTKPIDLPASFWIKFKELDQEYDRLSPEEKQRRQDERERELNERAQKEHREAQIQSMIRKSGIGEKFLKRTFEAYEITKGNKKYFQIFKKYADTFSEQKKGLYLSGEYGVGKTHLAAAVSNQLLNQGYTVLFLPVTSLKDRIYQSYKDKNTAEIVADVTNKDLLVLDDFDKLRANDGTRELMFGIMNRLYEAEKKVIITANCTRAALAEIYDGSIASRILEMCKCYEIEGEDWRARL